MMKILAAVILLAASLAASDGQSSRDVLHKRLKTFEESASAQLATISSAAEKSKMAAEIVQSELKPLLQLIAKEFETVDGENQQLRGANNRMTEEIKQLQETVSTLNATVIYKTDEADLLQKQLAEVKEKLVESGTLVEKNNELRQQLETLANKLTHLSLQYEDMKERVNKDLIAISEKETAIDELQKKTDQLSNQVVNLSTEKELLAGYLDSANKINYELRAKIKRMEKEIAVARFGYEMVGGRYVKYHDQQLNWTDAYQVCRNEGAQLITVRDDATTDWLISRYNTIWIGLTDHVEEGVWEWVDGAKANYTNWNPGEPNNWWGSENCVAVNYASFVWWSPGKWSDRSCSTEVRFACEIRYLAKDVEGEIEEDEEDEEEKEK